MCALSEKVKKMNPEYSFCPYCGSSFRPNGFIPTIYSIEYSLTPGILHGTMTSTSFKYKENQYGKIY